MVLFAANEVMESEFRRRCHGLQFPLAVVAGLRISLDGVAPQGETGELLLVVLHLPRHEGDDGGGVETQRTSTGKQQLTLKVEPVLVRPLVRPAEEETITDNTLCCWSQQGQMTPRPGWPCSSAVPDLADHGVAVVQITRLAQRTDQIHYQHWDLLSVNTLQHCPVLVAELDQLQLRPGAGVEGDGVALVPGQEVDHQPGEVHPGAAGELGQQVGGEVQVGAATVSDGLLGVKTTEEILQTLALALLAAGQTGGVAGHGQQLVRPALQARVRGGGGRSGAPLAPPAAHNSRLAGSHWERLSERILQVERGVRLGPGSGQGEHPGTQARFSFFTHFGEIIGREHFR